MRLRDIYKAYIVAFGISLIIIMAVSDAKAVDTNGGYGSFPVEQFTSIDPIANTNINYFLFNQAEAEYLRDNIIIQPVTGSWGDRWYCDGVGWAAYADLVSMINTSSCITYNPSVRTGSGITDAIVIDVWISVFGINLVAADTTAPVITMLGASPVDIFVDDTDGDLTGSIIVNNSVNTSLVGVYYVSYDVTDLAGNPAAQVVRTVNVSEVPVTTNFDQLVDVIIVLGLGFASLQGFGVGLRTYA